MERNYFGEARDRVDDAATSLDELETHLNEARDNVNEAYSAIDRAEKEQNPGLAPATRRMWGKILRDCADAIENK